MTISNTDTISSVAQSHKGKRISVRLRSGQELAGVVAELSDSLLVLAELSGREFFDAVVSLDAVEAIIIRTKQ